MYIEDTFIKYAMLLMFFYGMYMFVEGFCLFFVLKVDFSTNRYIEQAVHLWNHLGETATDNVI